MGLGICGISDIMGDWNNCFQCASFSICASNSLEGIIISHCHIETKQA